ncbi:MAG: DDE-type integrase/transposase/recombinase [Deltaproteobacteria bacterium]|nr:DDE-type integrase/transposase/recombinase [Deltaproteobacteria bacterium]
MRADDRRDTLDPRTAWALARYEVVSQYRAANPPRGRKEALRRQLAARFWDGPDGEKFEVAAETIRTWVRRYEKKGLRGLMDEPRKVQGVQVLTPEQVELVCNLKREVPERSIDRLIRIVEDMNKLPAGLLRRSTVHRVLQAHGISGRPSPVPDAQDLDRFEAAFPNDLWQSDMLYGPWLPDPEQPGRVRRAYLYAYLDDHSRLCLHGRFFFNGSLPALELVFRRALQKHGICRRVYYDNGLVYRSDHMKLIVATLDIHRIILTQPGRPMGHGKIEAFNKLVRASFLAELKASHITTLDGLNEAFLAWVDQYNRTVHSETGQAPLDRWRTAVDRIRYADEEVLRQAFLFRESRTADKTGVFSLLGIRYQVGPQLARRKVEIRFDPEEVHEVEIWHNGAFAQRARPLDIHAHRRPRLRSDSEGGAAAGGAPPQPVPTATPSATTPDAPGRGADWLGHLVEQRRQQGFVEPSPRQFVEQAHARRLEADRIILDLLRQRLDPEVLDEQEVLRWLAQYGPLDGEAARRALDRRLAPGQRADLHVRFVLEALREHPALEPVSSSPTDAAEELP